MDTHKKEMEFLSNSIAAYAHIRENPESFGLYFVLGVCFGLILTLCMLVIRISCKPRTPSLPSKPKKPSLKESSLKEPLSVTGDEEDPDSDDNEDTFILTPVTDTSLGSQPPMDGTMTINVFTSAEELERAQRLEERERIIREIWRNGQPDILGTGTGTIGRVHYY
ncbi:protein eva-1 homolog B [Hyla sarda]|uniref:protein eva-1 homolog B n=1 Tax=Hyla sarda TaxID=327740 RepID=UPI0024C21FE5|nr:protein eva-1 homolog B [Hyla sarda]XP_056416581.1 protein eva-1 homolog B [Hyla sarda]XP_056416582.1 protein eva-1 homolog B [Hyla sarda]XP_056416583.1 protein eva-1 homolog B [Hyla sarda]XP_056416584.1 protein eva-1 homolog B [Hyla sarda]XP_056416585.1 protein eva-1 homolog B [Hyla sarda]XP_056416587.1 protein eva-1 homolog B [Hyla sarda]XP_056416588.1 protein eva-1 homolog B [Hyla sarda]XP_056416589.1 protein eva-1 homolog B [Hyla sarda]